MTVTEAKRLARKLLDEHGHEDVQVETFQSKTMYGQYVEERVQGGGVHRRLRFSVPLLSRNPDKVEDTVRHEVAHAIAGARAGHSHEWVAACRITGADPQRSHEGVSVPPTWIGYCPNHGRIADRHRLTEATKRRICRLCRTRIEWRKAT